MEGCSKTEERKSQKVGCLQAQFGLGAASGPRDFTSAMSAAASNQCFRILKIFVGNVEIVCNLVLWQLTKSTGLLVGVMGFQQGFDAVLLKDTHLGFYGFHGKTRKNTAVSQKIEIVAHTLHHQSGNRFGKHDS